MKRIFICSPYKAETTQQRNKNLILAKELCSKAFEEQCAPFAPHLIYPQILDDTIAYDRDMAMIAGMSFLHMCDELWYSDRYGISEGMKRELEEAKNWKIKIVKK